MTYKVGYDGVASAELTRLLRGVQDGLNTHGAGLLMHVRAEDEATASAASAVNKKCKYFSKECPDGSLPTEPPNVVVTTDLIIVTAIVVVVTLLIGFGVGYRLGKRAVTTPNRS